MLIRLYHSWKMGVILFRSIRVDPGVESMRQENFCLRAGLLLLLICFLASFPAAAGNSGPDPIQRSTDEKLEKRTDNSANVKIILKLDVKDIERLTRNSRLYRSIIPGSRFPAGGVKADAELENAILRSAHSTLNQLNGIPYRLTHTYRSLPYLAIEVSPEAMAFIASLPEVLAVFEDKLSRPLDALKKPLTSMDVSDVIDLPQVSDSSSLIGADVAWSKGYTGSGWYVAILDTGLRSNHEFFSGKTIIEACFSANGDCPNGETSMTGPGAAIHHAGYYSGFDHGTHVAGIAAGNNGSMAGVAKNSSIIAVQVFSTFGIEDCGDEPCVMSWDSDQVKGLDYIYSLRGSYSIAAVNMSLGSGGFSSYCDSEPHKSAIDNLKAVGIATVAASGNDGYCGYVSSPACISSAVAVGASDKFDTEAWFNNWHESLQKVFAPGVSIRSANGGSDSGYEYRSGTSMAAPHVTGAWALMRQSRPTASVDELLSTLRGTGVPVATLCASGKNCPRINLGYAVGLPSASSLEISRAKLYFTSLIGIEAPATGPQLLWLNQSNDANPEWTVAVSDPWIACTPETGSGTGVLTVSVNPYGLTAGTYTGSIAVSSIDAPLAPKHITIMFTVKKKARDEPPFGDFATPKNGALVRSSIAFTGWALDDVEVASVQLFRKDGSASLLLGDAAFIEGARPDVEAAFPAYPGNHRAGWGYMMLTQSLPDGTYTIYAVVTDNTGNRINLGSKTISIDNADTVKPFGAIDTPEQGGIASGSKYHVQGWVLTPPPNKVPENGSTISVYIDGKFVGHPVYNVYREDIARFFPGYANSNGALAYITIDTSRYRNGVHSIHWTVTDSGGNTDGIGSRFFVISNSAVNK